MKITEELPFDKYELEAPLDDVIRNLQKIQDTYSKTHTNLRIDIHIRGSYGDDFVVAVLYGDREETDAERTARERTERNRIKLQEADERRKLAELKAKYETEE